MNPCPGSPRSALWSTIVVALVATSAVGQTASAGEVSTPADRLAALLATPSPAEAEVALVALRDGSAAQREATAARMRHTWHELPAVVADALVAEPALALALGRELALAPRPSWASFVQRKLRDERIAGDERCLWLAARGVPLDQDEAKFVVSVLLAGAGDDGVHAAFAVLPAELADRMVPRIHAALLEGSVTVGDVASWFDRLSDLGRARLLALAVALPPTAATDLCQYMVDAAPAVYMARAAEALDGKIPLERLWLQNAAPLLDRPERIERVRAALADPRADAELRRAAYLTLAQAKAIDDVVLDHAEACDDPAVGVFHLLDVAIDRIPAERLLTWLRGAPELSTATLMALGRRSRLDATLAAALLEPIRDAGAVTGAWTERAAIVLALRAAPEFVVANWSLLRTAAELLPITEALAARGEPRLLELLRGELAAAPAAAVEPVAAQRRRAALLLALASSGDAPAFAQLVQEAPAWPPALVRRCRALERTPTAAQAEALLAAAEAAAARDEAVAGELFDWAAQCRSAALAPRWRRLLGNADDLLAHEAALRALCAGEDRPALLAQLRERIQDGRWDETFDLLRYEFVSSLGDPVAVAELRLLAELVLLAPLAEPAAEAELVARWPDGAHGFPFVSAVAVALRRAPPAEVATAFGAVAAAVLADPRRDSLSRQRVLLLWRALEPAPALQQAVGIATHACLQALPGELGRGPAAWFAHQAAAAAGQHAAAADWATAAVAELLAREGQRRDARLFLDERDPTRGYDPWAALSAAPALAIARAAVAAGAVDSARQSAQLALDRCGHDRTARAEITRLLESLP